MMANFMSQNGREAPFAGVLATKGWRINQDDICSVVRARSAGVPLAAGHASHKLKVVNCRRHPQLYCDIAPIAKPVFYPQVHLLEYLAKRRDDGLVSVAVADGKMISDGVLFADVRRKSESFTKALRFS